MTRLKQCSFSLDQIVEAPLQLVWSIVRQFHNPKAYKTFIFSSSSSSSTLRNITHVSGFPAKTSVERLDELNDYAHVMVVSLVGGDHGRRLENYQGTISLLENDEMNTVVTEKYTVDVPWDSCLEDTRVFVDTLVGLNLRSLARVAEGMIA